MSSNGRPLRERRPAVLSAVLAAALLTLSAEDAHAQFGFLDRSPGDLSLSHAELEGRDNCNECHVDDTSELTEQKCLGCHDHQDLARRIRAGEGFHATERVQRETCWTCHTEHQGRGYDIMGWRHIGGKDAFDHEQDAGWALGGAHARTDCADCHTETNRQGLRTFLGEDTACESCHAGDSPHEFERDDMLDCARCHGETVWHPPKRNMDFDHNDPRDTDFALEGSHQDVSCRDCHPGAEFNLGRPQPGDCSHCHADPHDDHLFGERDCTWCHSPEYQRLERTRFNHAGRTGFELGGHRRLDCYDCHTDQIGTRTPDAACRQCHADDNVHEDRFREFGAPHPQCETCHPSTSWEPTEFEHTLQTDFALTGKHAQADCRDCHRGTDPAEFEFFEVDDVGCQGCHEHVDVHPGEDFTDAQCLECHQEAGDIGVDPQQAAELYHGPDSEFPLEKGHAGVSCELCHAGGYADTPAECGSCHEDSLHEGRLGEDCSTCHSPGEWPAVRFDHADDTDFPLRGYHQEIPQCVDCHPSRQFADTPMTCGAAGCHGEDDAHSGQLGTECSDCHTEFGENIFNHNEQADFALTGQHLETRCVECHSSLEFVPQPTDCQGCHPEPDVHRGLFGTDCAGCHSTETFADIQPLHDVGDFSLQGAHDDVACDTCHVDSRPLAGTGNLCINCHRQDDIHGNSLAPTCGDCHNQWSFSDAEFDHTTVGCNLTGIHRMVACADCHQEGNYRGLSSTCYSCHRDDALATGEVEGIDHAIQTNCGQCHNPNSWVPAQTEGVFGRESICR